MQKFGLLFLAVSTALLGLVVPVEGVALVDRTTNAERFARGLPPNPPNRREVAQRSQPSRRDPTPIIEDKRALVPALELRSAPSRRATAVEKRTPSRRATAEKRTPSRRATAEKRTPSRRATAEKRTPSRRATAEKRTPSRRATAEKRTPSRRATAVEKRTPSRRATVVEKRTPSRRATAVEKRTPSRRATAEKRTPSRRATSVEKRTQPSRRATEVEKRTQPSRRAEAEVFHAPHWQLTSGRLEVRWVHNNSIAGYVANNPTGGSFGLNTAMCREEDDLYVEYFDSNLMVMNAEFPPPYFVGGGDTESAVHDCSDKIRFGTVELGSSSAVWTIDPMSGVLTATLVNQDGSVDEPSLVYDPVHNVLSFTHDVNRNPMTEHAVNIYLSD